jgi:hypothetical protein
LIVNRVLRSRTVSPDLMSLALCTLIFTVSLTMSPFAAGYPEEENRISI